MNQISMQAVSIPVEPADRMMAAGVLSLPQKPVGIVLFAQGTGGGRDSPCHMRIAHSLHDNRFATLLVDMLSAAEDVRSAPMPSLQVLTQRVMRASDWMRDQTGSGLPVGYVGSCAAGAAVLRAAALQPGLIRAVICCAGQPELLAESLSRVHAATLLVVGARDEALVDSNRRAYERLNPPKHMAIVSGAIHPAEEHDALQEVAMLAADWFERYLAPSLAARN